MEEIAIADPQHVHQPLVQAIVDELNGRGRCPSTGESAARTAWVMDEMLDEFRAAQSDSLRRSTVLPTPAARETP